MKKKGVTNMKLEDAIYFNPTEKLAKKTFAKK